MRLMRRLESGFCTSMMESYSGDTSDSDREVVRLGCEGVPLPVADSGRMDVDLESRIVQASKTFGALRKAVFLDKNLTLTTKRKVCVLSVLLYGFKC